VSSDQKWSLVERKLSMMCPVPYRSDRENQAISGRAKWLFGLAREGRAVKLKTVIGEELQVREFHGDSLSEMAALAADEAVKLRSVMQEPACGNKRLPGERLQATFEEGSRRILLRSRTMKRKRRPVARRSIHARRSRICCLTGSTIGSSMSLAHCRAANTRS
jgi:hypothetical protein